MALVVQKYGGSSLASPRLIREVAARIGAKRADGYNVVVVVSAMGRMTDHLIRLAYRTVEEPPQRELDMLMTAGERISMALLAMALHEKGIPAISFTGSQSGIVTTSNHTNARILEIRPQRIQAELEKGRVVIVAGFQGVSLEKEVTTLGRGGSDTSAVALASALKADCCEVFTDVDGLFTADPRLVPSARLINRCSYAEAIELANLGAKLQGRSVELANKFKVKVWMASTFKGEQPGTWISEEVMERATVSGIATKDGYTLMTVKAPMKDLLSLLRSHSIAVRMLSLCDDQVSFIVETEKSRSVHKLISALGWSAQIQENKALVSAVGEGFTSAETLPLFVDLLHAAQVTPQLLFSHSLSVSAVVDSGELGQAARALHAGLIECPVSN